MSAFEEPVLAEILYGARSIPNEPGDDAWAGHDTADPARGNGTRHDQPRAGKLHIASVPQLDPAALYGPAGDYVRMVQPHTEADPAAVLAQLLVGFGNMIGSGPRFVADGAGHRARLFVVVVGATSKARKGTSWRQARRPLYDTDRTWAGERVGGGLASGEGLIEAVADPTTDKNGDPVGGTDDKRLLVLEEEFGRVLTAGGRDGSTLSHVIREMWDAEADAVRTRTKTPSKATAPHVSIVGHITVEELRSKLTETDRANGFANRFVYVHAQRARLLPHGGGAPPEDEYRRLVDRLRRAKAAAATIGTVTRSPAADELWAVIYEELAEDDPGGIIGALTARAEAQVLRLSMAYALTEGSAVIDVPHLNAALALWSYSRDTVAHVFGDRLGDPVADALLTGIRAAGAAGLDRTAQSALFGRNKRGDELERARELLLRKRLIVDREEKTGGRPRLISIAVEFTKYTK